MARCSVMNNKDDKCVFEVMFEECGELSYLALFSLFTLFFVVVVVVLSLYTVV